MVCRSCVFKLAKRLVKNHPRLDWIDALTRAYKGVEHAETRRNNFQPSRLKILALNGGGGDPTFGKTNIGTYTDPIWNDPNSIIDATFFTCPERATLDSLTVALQSETGLAQCGGTAKSCTQHGNQVDCEICGCDWNATISRCGGTPYDCGTHGWEGDCSLCGCTWATPEGEYSVKLAAYDKNRNFIASTEERVDLKVPTSPTWYTFNFPSPPTQDGDEIVYFAVWAKATKNPNLRLYVLIDVTDDARSTSKQEAYNSWPATLLAPSLYYECSIYCTYTPALAKKPVGDGLTFAI